MFPELRSEVEAMQTAKTKSTYQEKEQNTLFLLSSLLLRGSQNILVKKPRN